MKIHTLAGLLLLVIVFLLGSHTAQPARAQVAGSGPVAVLKYMSLVHVDDGTGNLVVGYNELGNPNGDDRTGSHNTASGDDSSVSGGLNRLAIGDNNWAAGSLWEDN